MKAAGAKIVADADAVYGKAELVVKVKEPLAVERKKLRRDQVLFAYLHLAPDRAQTEDLMRSGVTAIAYETVTGPNGALPLLTPMSEVAGRMAPHVGARCLEKENGGRGVLLGWRAGCIAGERRRPRRRCRRDERGVDCVRHGRRCCGAGPQSGGAAPPRTQFGGRVRTLFSTRDVVEVSLPARRFGHRDRSRAGRHGAEIDLAADGQGDEAGLGDRRRRDRPGRLRRNLAGDNAFDPTYIVDGVVHYCVANMPGAVARTSTFALSNVTTSFVLALADKGWRDGAARGCELRAGLNVHDGSVTYRAVAEAFGLPYEPADNVLDM